MSEEATVIADKRLSRASETSPDDAATEDEMAVAVEKPSSDSTDARARTYDKRKTIAHGMMDTALISANANQLKFIVQYYRNRDSLILGVLVTLIALSLSIQIAVGIALIFRHKKRDKSSSENDANGLNVSVDDFIIMGVFLVIIINIFIAAFSTEPANA